MGMFDWFGNSSRLQGQVQQLEAKLANVEKQAISSAPSIGTFIGGIGFNGEKILGELSPMKNYVPNYWELRNRSWQSFYESEIAQMVINKYISHVIGRGLKAQSEPSTIILDQMGFSIDRESFTKQVEAIWGLYSTTSSCDYANMDNLATLQMEAEKNAIIGGDVLVILRLVDGYVKVQLIDGQHVCSPNYGTESFPRILENGNRILDGIEMLPNNEHIAYHVRTYDKGSPYSFRWERVLAKDEETGLKMAYLLKYKKMKLDNHRGVPLLMVVLQIISQINRYRDATLMSAEERAKLVWQVVHTMGSSGENPFNKVAKIIRGSGDDLGEVAVDINGKELTGKVFATTGKQSVNMPVNAELKAVESKTEQYSPDFFTSNIDVVCASLSIPPEVAKSMYGSNYMASSAARKDWEHEVLTRREKFSFDFLQPIYNMVLHVEILKGTIKAKGYLKALISGNIMVVESYRKARFVGASIPHPDPVKEAQAQRLLLGPLGANLPLTTGEAATERLNQGDFLANIEQFGRELEESESAGIQIQTVAEPTKKPTGQ